MGPHPLQGSGHIQATPISTERSNFLGRRRSGLSPYETLCPGPGASTIIFAGGGGILTADGVTPGLLRAYRLPFGYPQTTGNNPKHSLFDFPPHGTLLINYSNFEGKEERAQTLKPWELVNQELKFKTNALSCGAPLPFFFFLQFC